MFVVIVSMLVLHLKAVVSLLETSQCTSEHNSVEVQKNPDYEVRKEQILSGIGKGPDLKIRINWRFLHL